MTAKTRSRRSFLETTTLCGGCLLAVGLAPRAGAGETGEAAEPKRPDFEKLSYCCYECDPKQCPLLKASLANDLELKKEFAGKWKERYGRDFMPEEVSCFGCKVEPERQGYAVRNCDVRACVIERKLVSCAHCPELAGCQRRLWVNYPKFREHVLGIQRQVVG